MERQRFVVNGGIKMPIGFRFRPTEEELVTHYLKRKVLNLPLPASVIPEFNVFQTDPWRLPGDVNEKKRYFFGHSGKVNASDNNNNCRIATGCGYWRTIGKQKMVVAPRSNQVIGTRQAFVFMQKKHPQGPKTRWFLHQFCLLGSSTSTPKPTQVEMQDWVVHSLFQKKRKAKKVDKSSKVAKPQASPCSSGVTDEHCSNEVASTLDQEATSFKSV